MKDRQAAIDEVNTPLLDVQYKDQNWNAMKGIVIIISIL